MASGAGGSAGGGGGGAGGPGGGGPQGAGNGGGGGGGSNQGAGPPSPPAPPGTEGQAAGGHPIDVVTGTLFTEPVVDFQLPGFLWVTLIRHYRTSSVAFDAGIATRGARRRRPEHVLPLGRRGARRGGRFESSALGKACLR
ncbi:DUF6531 domain-containing protein [Sorangium sp. KYC3313]|uniref:DUF6531 domain-containing protein n=1 Tax=Sorangium sp. KYC3313 TaxID=3449740 RepID=UPI003F88776F